jgi:hypothetical protein
LPRGASTLARILIARADTIDLNALSTLQRAAPEALPGLGAAWIRYCAANYDVLAAAIPRAFERARTALVERSVRRHGGLTDSAARLSTCWRVFLAFGTSIGALDEQAATTWSTLLDTVLEDSTATTDRAIDVERSESEYIDLIRNLLESDAVTIEGLDGYGISSEGVGGGWHDPITHGVYLKVAVIDPLVRRLYRDQTNGLPFPIDAARRGLLASGALVFRDKDQVTVARRGPSNLVSRVLAVRADLLEAPDVQP